MQASLLQVRSLLSSTKLNSSSIMSWVVALFQSPILRWGSMTKVVFTNADASVRWRINCSLKCATLFPVLHKHIIDTVASVAYVANVSCIIAYVPAHQIPYLPYINIKPLFTWDFEKHNPMPSTGWLVQGAWEFETISNKCWHISRDVPALPVLERSKFWE